MISIVHQAPADTAVRLADLGLDPETLRDAIAMGEAARNSGTPNDPAITAGHLAWGRSRSSWPSGSSSASICPRRPSPTFEATPPRRRLRRSEPRGGSASGP